MPAPRDEASWRYGACRSTRAGTRADRGQPHADLRQVAALCPGSFAVMAVNRSRRAASCRRCAPTAVTPSCSTDVPRCCRATTLRFATTDPVDSPADRDGPELVDRASTRKPVRYPGSAGWSTTTPNNSGSVNGFGSLCSARVVPWDGLMDPARCLAVDGQVHAPGR